MLLKRMGPADQVTSHLYSFGIRGKQFQYVEGKLPEGFPFHGRLTDHDLRNLQGRGAEVLILEPHYTAEDLKQARDQCRKLTDTDPNHTVETIAVEVSSTPPAAEVELDGNFVGSTPSQLNVPIGEHNFRITKNGYAVWERKMKLTSGAKVNIAPELAPVSSATSEKSFETGQTK